MQSEYLGIPKKYQRKRGKVGYRPKTHYLPDPEIGVALCGRKLSEEVHRWTQDQAKVECRRCLTDLLGQRADNENGPIQVVPAASQAVLDLTLGDLLEAAARTHTVVIELRPIIEDADV